MPTSTKNQVLVVIAASARILAGSAARAFPQVIAIDLFGDRDTQDVAESITLPALESNLILQVIGKITRKYGKPLLVYGSGIDNQPGLVAELARTATVVGNRPSALREINTPSLFFPALDRHSVPYPAIRYDRPNDIRQWLYKIPFQEGGCGIIPGLMGSGATPGGYYQKRVQGVAMSVLLVANQQVIHVIGFNTQWTTDLDRSKPYRFCGIMNCVELSRPLRLQVVNYATKLVKSVPLAGLISVDFVVDNGQCKVLEVNPRPSASMALYDQCYPKGLLRQHIHSFLDLALDQPHRQNGNVQGMEIVYADRACIVGSDFTWPEWTADRPPAGGKIDIAQPVCTVTASGTSGAEVRDSLRKRSLKISRQFFAESEFLASSRV